MKKILALLTLFSLLHAEEYQFTGIHYMASFTGCDHAALCNLPTLQQAMADGVAACGATLLKSADFVFEPDAITMVLLLSESHASIHTYPEHNACYIDLFTCGNRCDYTEFERVLKEYLKPKVLDTHVLKR